MHSYPRWSELGGGKLENRGYSIAYGPLANLLNSGEILESHVGHASLVKFDEHLLHLKLFPSN